MMFAVAVGALKFELRCCPRARDRTSPVADQGLHRPHCSRWGESLEYFEVFERWLRGGPFETCCASEVLRCTVLSILPLFSP